jgi:hypothetical protein
MAQKGIVAPFDFAIFADTKFESRATYDHLSWLEQVGKVPILKVSRGDIRADIEAGSIREWKVNRTVSMPFFTVTGGKVGRMRRQCTKEYKVEPIQKEIRRILGVAPRRAAPLKAVQLAIGFSWDERHRRFPDRYRATANIFPLIEMRWTVDKCLAWLQDNFPGIKVPRSSCVGCPYHNNQEWRSMQDDRPEEWAAAIDFDQTIRRKGGIRGDLFLHRKCVPIEDVDFRTAEELGQGCFNFAKAGKLAAFADMEI